MKIDEVYDIIRKLAKTPHYQNLYLNVKELHFKLFVNDRDFSPLQTSLLTYLSFYSNLFTDIYLGDVDERVLSSEIYEDSYIYYKRTKKEEPVQNAPQNTQKKDIQWIFKKPNKRVME